MLFSSTVFLFLFLPLLTVSYLLAAKSVKPYVLLSFSLFFYGWGEPRYLAVVLFICTVNYLAAVGMGRSSQKWQQKVFLAAAVLTDLLVLGYFKYFNFFLDTVNTVMGKQFGRLHIIMPIGVSFFTFQAISYIVDVYRKDVPVQYNLGKLVLYISFFPQLIAGPIVKYHDIEQDLERNSTDFSSVSYGIQRFIIGLGKKVLLANSLGNVADQIFGTGYQGADMAIAWLGAVCYSLQLYFDFAGYSDMAIGLGRIFGFHFLENFNFPYISQSITEFWRRWHISLGTWFKEYLYFPLGGNRKGKNRTYINLGIVFLITGLWHGANWTFVLWGAWHGFFVILERMLGVKNWQDGQWRFLRHIYTVFVFVIGWTMFRADTVSEGLGFIRTMLHLAVPDKIPFTAAYYLTPKTVWILCLAVLYSTPVFAKAKEKISARVRPVVYTVGKEGLLTLILILSVAYLAASTYNPFIYFRF